MHIELGKPYLSIKEMIEFDLPFERSYLLLQVLGLGA